MPAGDRGAGAGELGELCLVRVQLRAGEGERADNRDTGSGDDRRASQYKPCPATPRAVFRTEWPVEPADREELEQAGRGTLAHLLALGFLADAS